MVQNKNVILKDILWYLVGNLAPLIVGLIKSPIYTRIFTPEDFGAYSLVFLLFSYLSIICYSWIVSCVWRYYHQYKQQGKLSVLYSNLMFLYLMFSCLIFLFAAVWFGITDNILIRKLIILCFLQFFTSELTTMFFIRPRLEGRTSYYNLIQTVRAAGSFGLLLLLTFKFGFGIEAFLISNIILNVIIIAFTVIPDYFRLHITFRLVDRKDLKVFYTYGRIGIMINVCTALLISSDRFIIQYFTGLTEVGIYNQNYNIAQISIAVLINVYWAALNPYLLPVLEFRPPDLKEKIYEFFKTYFITFFPVTVYFILYGRNIAGVMLGEDFQEGYPVIYYVAISEFITGFYFINLSNLKFKNKFKNISSAFLLALIINVALNILLIPLYGYQVAAVTTVGANLVLMLMMYLKDPETRFLTDLFSSKEFRISMSVIVIQTVIHFIAAGFTTSLGYFITEGIIFLTIYLLIMARYIRFDKIKPLAEPKSDNE